MELRDAVQLLGVIVAIVTFALTRSRELRWQRTEFLFDQARYLDNDPDVQLAVALLGGHEVEGRTVREVFSDGRFCPGVSDKVRHGFEKLFNLLDRLGYAESKRGSIDHEELVNFGWYLREIRGNCEVARYCEENGYADVVALSTRVLGPR